MAVLKQTKHLNALLLLLDFVYHNENQVYGISRWMNEWMASLSQITLFMKTWGYAYATMC